MENIAGLCAVAEEDGPSQKVRSAQVESQKAIAALLYVDAQ